nr:serine/threonine protein kinase [Xenococcus sp. MO_188.B8]
PRNFVGIEPMLAILKTQPVPIRDRNPNVPEYLADLIDLALKDDPELHFKSALEFKNTLLAVL